MLEQRPGDHGCSTGSATAWTDNCPDVGAEVEHRESKAQAKGWHQRSAGAKRPHQIRNTPLLFLYLFLNRFL
jgi:hypothetical protein